MKSIKFNVHSVVDVITNSSTCIYTQATAGSIQSVKDIINSLLALGETDLTADDLFDIKITSDELIDQRKEMLGDRGTLDEYLGREISWNDDDFDAKIDELYDKIEAGEYEKPDFWDKGYGDYGFEGDSKITVTAKIDNSDAKTAAKLLSRLDGLFHSDERSC
jgi:hypothetical protein